MSILTNPAGVEKIARAGYQWAALDSHREVNR
jgi:hypothetical protein